MLKIESVTKNTLFGLKIMVKSGLGKFILESFHVFSRPSCKTLSVKVVYSTTTWTKFYPILTPTPRHPLNWTKMNILHTIYHLPGNQPLTFY